MLLTFFKRLSSTHSYTSPLNLRPYQEQCLDACLDALASGASRIGVSLPTGSGKTTVFISLLSRISTPEPGAWRSLIIVNSIELARQSADQVIALFPKWSVEIEQGIKHKATGDADVTVATYQTLLNAERLRKFDPQRLKAIIVDEAHHAAAPSYRRLLSHFDPNIKNPDPSFKPPKCTHRIPIIGFSATFSRHDGLALGSVFERIVYHRDFLEMIKEQWLCGVRFTTVHANLNLKDVTINARTGDFNPSSLAHVVNSGTVNELVVKTWLDRAATRKSTLVFCVNIAHVMALTQAFREHGIDARYIYSQTPMTERKTLIQLFKTGHYPVLVNCSILTEGADIPNIDCVLVARPTRSKNVFAQMIGRGMRLSPKTGKTDCCVIDFVDSTSRVAGVISTPTLFGLHPEEIEINDETAESLERHATEAITRNNTITNIPRPRSVTFVEHENPFSSVSEASGAPHVATYSRYAWVGCGDDIYVLECMGKGHVRVEPIQTREGVCFEAHFTPVMLDKHTAASLNLSPFMRSRHILSAQTLGDAIRGCDTYVGKKIAHGSLMSASLLRTARWRKSPASESQKRLIEKRWIKQTMKGQILDGSANVKMEKLERLTMGEAANVITRLKHGAQKRYEKKLRAVARAESTSHKEKLRKDREVVKVGPLCMG